MYSRMVELSEAGSDGSTKQLIIASHCVYLLPSPESSTDRVYHDHVSTHQMCGAERDYGNYTDFLLTANEIARK